MRKIFLTLLLVLIISLWGCVNAKTVTAPSYTSPISTAPTTSITNPTTIPSISETVSAPTEPEVNLPIFTFELQQFEYKQFNHLKDLQAERNKLAKYTTDFALACSQYIIQLPIEDDSSEVQLAWEFYNTVLKVEQIYLTKLAEQYTWDYRALEYPIATQVWLYMKNEFGWNDVVCAGVMGNLMAECGGCWTHDLDWQIDKSSGLGMVQWIGGRRDEIIAKYGPTPTVEEQLIFMKDELYGTNGITKQVSNNQLDEIMNAETPGDCAFAFASYYERCSKKYREIRRDYADRAYQYFTTDSYMKEN